MKSSGFVSAFVFALAASSASAAQAPQCGSDLSTLLPCPGGSFGIGRITYFWTDSTRAEFLDPVAKPRRELLVDVWYPVAPGTSGESAPYLPEMTRIRELLGDSLGRRRFGPAYLLAVAGRLTTHAASNVKARCAPRPCPVIVFSHGGGVDRSSYSVQFEDLASHGFVVASIAHTFDSHLVLFPDGRALATRPAPADTVPPNSSIPRWRQELEREGRGDAYRRRLMQVEAADIRFVIDRLRHLADDKGAQSPWRGQLDLDHLGAFGHSLGGESAALACQLDDRIKACLNQDGAAHGLPFSRDAAGRTMRQPFMYLTRSEPRPVMPDAALTEMQISRAQMDSVLDDVWGGAAKLLNGMPGGAYRVLLRTPAIEHMSFTDEPLLRAGADSAKRADALRSLQAVCEFTRAFFDKTLHGRSATILEGPSGQTAFALIERYRRP